MLTLDGVALYRNRGALLRGLHRGLNAPQQDACWERDDKKLNLTKAMRICTWVNTLFQYPRAINPLCYHLAALPAFMQIYAPGCTSSLLVQPFVLAISSCLTGRPSNHKALGLALPSLFIEISALAFISSACVSTELHSLVFGLHPGSVPATEQHT
jgi:hypothetical protein